MAGAVLGTRRQGAALSGGGLGRLERDARRKEQERLAQRSSNLLGGGGLGQNPVRRPAPLAGLGR